MAAAKKRSFRFSFGKSSTARWIDALTPGFPKSATESPLWELSGSLGSRSELSLTADNVPVSLYFDGLGEL